MITERVQAGDTIKLDTDNWDDVGTFNVLSASYRADNQAKYTTAVDLIIENVDGEVLKRTVASHQIIKL